MGNWCSILSCDYYNHSPVQYHLKRLTFEPVSPGAPRPPSTPARPYRISSPVNKDSLQYIKHLLRNAVRVFFYLEPYNTQDIAPFCLSFH